MAGKKENIGPMWATLRANGLELEPAVSLKSNVYLGCAQREIVPDMDLMYDKREMMTRLCHGSGSGKPDGTNIPDLRVSVKEFIPDLTLPQNQIKRKRRRWRRKFLIVQGNALSQRAGGNSQRNQRFPAIPMKCSGIVTRLSINILTYLENLAIPLKLKQLPLVLTTTSSPQRNSMSAAFFLLQLLALF